MRTVSLIAAGLLVASWTAARAEAGTADGTNAIPAPRNIEVTPPPTTVDVNVSPPPTQPTSPPSALPGTIETQPPATATTPSGAEITPPANVDLNVSPPVQPAPVAAPVQREVMPPARVINTNTAAIFGAVKEDSVPVQPLPSPNRYQRGEAYDTGHTWVSRIGAGVLVGGGFEDFTNSTLRDMTGGAGVWNARVLAGTRQYIGVEAAYVGAARGIDALGVQSNAVLLSNGVEGALRLNVPVVIRRAQLLEPFGFVGIGWSHYQLTNTNVNTADLAKDDDVMSLPIGGGLEYAINRFMADARFTYRSTYYNDLMRSGGNLNNWGVSTQIGFSF